MSEPELGTLEVAPLRDAWRHEAHSFTPWLASNLGQLGDALGIPLELEGTEVAVESFSADILARNPLDDTLVLIENQLEQTDHTHLGQIMTYLAGLGAHTIIWVAPEFREPHISAVNWLNEHTVDPFSFFAVQVRVVRIGDSPLAPMFDVLAKPNAWERQLQAVARRTGEMSEIGQFRLSFWSNYVGRFSDEAIHGAPGGTSSRWRWLDDLGLAVTQFIGKDSVGVFVRGLRGRQAVDVAEQLEPRQADLEARLGVELGDGSRNQFLTSRRQVDTNDPEVWDDLADWMHEISDLYEKTLLNIFGAEST